MLRRENMDIRCRKLKCVYNDHFTCKAKNLNVTKGAVCSVYKPDESKSTPDTSQTLFERTPKYSPQRDSKTIDICCKADCLLKHEGMCIANGITVNDYRSKPCCMAFLKK